LTTFIWAARYNTWLLIKLTPKGVVFSFLFSDYIGETFKGLQSRSLALLDVSKAGLAGRPTARKPTKLSCLLSKGCNTNYVASMMVSSS